MVLRVCRQALLCCCGLLLAASALAQPGQLSGFSFLRLEPSARAAALGGAFTAMYGDDVNVIFYNPALLNEQTHDALSLSYLNHLSDLNAGFIAYSRHIEAVGTLGAGLRFLSWGELQAADEEGNQTGTFGASDVALTLGLARAYNERFRYGANVHTIFSSIDSSTTSPTRNSRSVRRSTTWEPRSLRSAPCATSCRWTSA
jgi:long-subunit fatty acid transport protein